MWTDKRIFRREANSDKRKEEKMGGSLAGEATKYNLEMSVRGGEILCRRRWGSPAMGSPEMEGQGMMSVMVE